MSEVKMQESTLQEDKEKKETTEFIELLRALSRDEQNQVKSLRPVGNTRSNFYCEHPNHEYIRKYYAEHKIYRLQGFIGFGARYSEEVPVKTSPAWCPKKAEGNNE